MIFPGQRLLAVLLAGVWLAVSAAAVASSDAGIIRLEAGGHRITAELAMSPAARQRGLMQRAALPDDHGMLFVYAEPERICMWMKDTPIPLSVAFLDDRGVIINVAEMRPLTLDTHCAERPARYALEMTRGWFTRRGLTPGTRITGLERLPAGP